MTEFIASTKLIIKTEHNVTTILDLATGDDMLEGMPWLSGIEMEALREFFRHEEDERLGRWRWPENPAYVVYPAPRDGTKQADFDAFVVDEALGASGEYVRADDDGNSIVLASPLTLAARAYFAAHPPRRPILLQAQEDGTDEWFTIRTYPGDPGDRAHADASAHLLTSQDVPARVIEGGTA